MNATNHHPCNSAASGTACTCIFQVKRHLHPLEFSSITSNVQHHGGKLKSFCNLILLSNRMRCAAASLSSTTDVVSFFDLGLIMRVVERGIKRKLGICSRVPNLISCPLAAQEAAEVLNIAQLMPIGDGVSQKNIAGSLDNATEVLALVAAQKASHIDPCPRRKKQTENFEGTSNFVYLPVAASSSKGSGRNLCRKICSLCT